MRVDGLPSYFNISVDASACTLQKASDLDEIQRIEFNLTTHELLEFVGPAGFEKFLA